MVLATPAGEAPFVEGAHLVCLLAPEGRGLITLQGFELVDCRVLGVPHSTLAWFLCPAVLCPRVLTRHSGVCCVASLTAFSACLQLVLVADSLSSSLVMIRVSCSSKHQCCVKTAQVLQLHSQGPSKRSAGAVCGTWAVNKSCSTVVVAAAGKPPTLTTHPGSVLQQGMDQVAACGVCQRQRVALGARHAELQYLQDRTSAQQALRSELAVAGLQDSW